MAVRETLELDFSKAFRDVRTLDEALSSAAGHFSQGISRAVNQLGTTKIGVDSSGIDKVSRSANEAKKNLGAAKEEAGQLGFSLARAGEVAGGIGLAIGAKQLLDFFKDTVLAASDLAESTSKAGVVFGQSVDQVEAFGKSAAESFGLSEQAALEATATFGNLFTSLGLGKAPAADMSIAMVQLAADLASFNNIPIEDALIALRSGVVGEIEPLRRLGVSFNAAQVEAKAMALGFVDSSGEVTEAGKVQARYALILEQTKTAQGDFARTSDGLANTLRIIKAEAQNTSASLGQELLPDILDLARAGLEALPAFTDLAHGGFGTLSTVISGLLPFLQLFNTVLNALPHGFSGATIGAISFGKAFREIGQSRGIEGAQLNRVTALGAAFGAAAVGAREFEGELGKAASSMISTTAAGAALGTAIGGPGLGTAIGAGAGLLLGVGKEIGLFGQSEEDAAASTKKLAGEIESLGQVAATERFIESLGLDLGSMGRKLRDLAADSPAAAERVGAGLIRIGASEDVVNKAVRQGTADFQKSTENKKAASDTNAALADSTLTVKDALKEAEKAQKDFDAAMQKFVDSAVSKLPTVGGALQETEKQLSSFGLTLADAVAPEVFIHNLQSTLIQIAAFPAQIQGLLEAGLTDLAAFLAQQGPEVAAPILKSLQDAGPLALVATDQLLGNVKGAVGDFQGFMTANAPVLTGSIANPFVAAEPLVGDAAVRAVGETAGALLAGVPGITGAATTAGQALPTGFGAGAAGLPGVASDKTQAAQTGIDTGARGLANPAYVAGALVGGAIGDGIAGGLASRAGAVASAMRNVVNIAIQAGINAAGAHSPSKVAAKEIGLPIAQGTALGINTGEHLVARASSGMVDSAMSVGGLTRAFSGALGGAGLGQITLIKVGSGRDALALLPAAARSNAAFLDL